MNSALRKVVGLTIWWTEGTKPRYDTRWGSIRINTIDVTNTNPQIIKAFLNFLRKDIKIDERRLKLQLHIHEGDDKNLIETYWSKITSIPKSRFNKTIIRPIGKKPGKSKGTCKIRYTDKKSLDKIISLLDNLIIRRVV